ncbi:MAG: tripartite tricarboxylate transporter substrate binding protein [Clostridia bacterium]|nr:tripartite tricarboxylate transporter substrate binding protein [Clostridia bacterium]
MKKLIALIAVLTLCLSVGMTAMADASYPANAVTFICPWDAGGTSDSTSRIMAELFAKQTGVNTAVENQGGAGGTIATTEFKNTKPDGTAICLEAIGVFTLQPFTREVSYSIDDFIPVCSLTQEPILLLAGKESGLTSLQDIIDRGSVVYGSNGTGSLMELSEKKLFADAGVDAIGIPYDGSATTLAALLGGHVDVCTCHPSEGMQYVESGDAVALGIFNDERDPRDFLKDIPTIKEQGYDVVMSVWKFFIMPATTPQEIIDQATEILNQCKASEEFADYCEKNNLLILGLDTSEMIEKIKAEAEVNKVMLGK